jgi:hypothetical protein
MTKKNHAAGLYQAPTIEFVEVCSEGVLCASPDVEKELEDLFEHAGHWGN